MRLRVLKQVALTSFREFIRTPEAVFWTIAARTSAMRR